MRVLVLRINRETYVPSRLKKEAEKRNWQVDILNYQQLICFLDNPFKIMSLSGSSLSRYDAFVFRAAGTTSGTYLPFRNNLIRFFSQRNKFCLNGQSYLQVSRLDKLTQHYLLQQNSIPVVKTLVFGKHIELNKVKTNLMSELNLPILVKPKLGSQGKNIFLIKEENKLIEQLQDLKAKTYQDLSFWLFQQYLTTKADYRIIVVGKEVIGGMKRTAAENNFITNFSQGGKIKPAQLDDEKKELALKAAQSFKLDFAGVDIMEDKEGNNYILEVNRACWFEGFETSTGINVAGKIINLIDEKKAV